MNISPKEFKNKLLNNEHLPSGLVVHSWLNLTGCTSLTHLPEGLKVIGTLSTHGCTSLTHLPSGLVVDGWLDIYNCPLLTHLPEGLVVKKEIFCDKEFIDIIPREDLPLYINFPFEEKMFEYLIQRIQQP